MDFIPTISIHDSSTTKDSGQEAWNCDFETYDMVPLHALRVRSGGNALLIDGDVSYEGTHYHLHAVPFVTLSIEGYGDTKCHSVSESVWIQTQLGEKSNVYYRLTTPRTDYFKHHSTFLWIADLGKYFVDYLLERDSVALVDFQGKFHQCLVKLHGYSSLPRLDQPIQRLRFQISHYSIH